MRTMIAVPCMDHVATGFFRSCVGLQLGQEDEIQWTTCQSSLVYDARDRLTDMAIDGKFDRVLWLDSDMVFDRYLLRRLSEHLDLGREMITGLYFGRKAPIRPMIYRDLRIDTSPEGRPVPAADNYDDYEKDSLFPVAGCGFGCCMTTVSLLERVRDRFGLPFFPAEGFGEDFAFCRRARALGAEIWCDSSIKGGHEGVAILDESAWRRSREREADT